LQREVETKGMQRRREYNEENLRGFVEKGFETMTVASKLFSHVFRVFFFEKNKTLGKI
jgi:hypothetical protein